MAWSMHNRFFSVAFGLALSCVNAKSVQIFGCDDPATCTRADAGESFDAGTEVIDAGPPRLEVLAGDVGGEGNLDGVGREARFNRPAGIAIDAKGVVYASDTGNHVIRKISKEGVVSTFAGFKGVAGFADGAGNTARFSAPSGLAVDQNGNVLVADTGNHRIRQISPQGRVSTIGQTAAGSGSEDGPGSGPGAVARFYAPSGVAVDPFTNVVYVTDTNNRIIRSIQPDGLRTVSTIAGVAGMGGFIDGARADARLSAIAGIVFSRRRVLLVQDARTIRVVQLNGTVTTVAGNKDKSESIDGQGLEASFGDLGGLIEQIDGSLLAGDRGGRTIRKISPTFAVTTFAGKASEAGATDGSLENVRFGEISAMAADSDGNVWFTDLGNSTIRKISAMPGTAPTVVTVAGKAASSGNIDEVGELARFAQPAGILVTASGRIIIGDTRNDSLRTVTPNGQVSTQATQIITGKTMTPLRPVFLEPAALAVWPDETLLWTTASIFQINRPPASGEVYYALIRSLRSDGQVTTLAGEPGQYGSVNGVGKDARFSFPRGLAADQDKTLYVADTGNHTIRRVSASGVVTTLAGSPGITGITDDAGDKARFNSPRGLALGPDGTLYVCDSVNNTIRKVTKDGLVSTFCGGANLAGADDGSCLSAARFNAPTALAFDSTGALFVADTGNHTIRKISAAGEVTTVLGRAGAWGAVPGLLPATLSSPQGLAFLPSGQLLVTTSNGIMVTVAASF